jgi:SsrA-binding protein
MHRIPYDYKTFSAPSLLTMYFLPMQIMARNKKAFHDYEIVEKVVAGIALSGSEVKSIRAGKISLADSFASCSNGEMFLNHMHIAPYGFTNSFSPDTYRKRKLLLHKKQIYHFYNEIEKKHLTMVPLMVYFDKQWIKVELGLGKGLKKYDKREKIAAQESKKRLAQIMKDRNQQ